MRSNFAEIDRKSEHLTALVFTFTARRPWGRSCRFVSILCFHQGFLAESPVPRRDLPCLVRLRVPHALNRKQPFRPSLMSGPHARSRYRSRLPFPILRILNIPIRFRAP
jgi:hypothetical protein